MGWGEREIETLSRIGADDVEQSKSLVEELAPKLVPILNATEEDERG